MGELVFESSVKRGLVPQKQPKGNKTNKPKGEEPFGRLVEIEPADCVDQHQGITDGEEEGQDEDN